MNCGIPGANLPLGGPRLELLKPPTCLLAFKSRERWRMSGRRSSPLASHSPPVGAVEVEGEAEMEWRKTGGDWTAVAV